MTEEHEVVIQFRNVTKTFDLFKNDKQRLKSLLFHNTNAKKKVAIDNLSFDIRQLLPEKHPYPKKKLLPARQSPQ